MKRIKSVGIIVLAICLLILAYFAGRGIRYWFMEGRAFAAEEGQHSPENEPEDISVEEAGAEEPKYVSDTLPEDCKLCGGSEGTLVQLYQGQDNLGIISLNTFEVANIRINRYDDDGKLIEEPESGLGTNILNTGEDGFMSMVTANANRGYASADISMNKDKVLDMEKASANLCAECLNRVLDENWREPYGVGLINFKTGEVRLFDESIRGFMLGDFYVLCEPRTEGDEEEISEIDLNIFYCPERYE